MPCKLCMNSMRCLCWSTHPVFVTGLHPESPGRSPLVLVVVSVASHQGGCGGHGGARSGAGKGGRGGGGTGSSPWAVDHKLLELRGPRRVLRLLLLLDELLGRLEVLQGDALGAPPGLPDPLGVGLPLDLMLLITDRRHKGSKSRKLD